MGMNLEKQSNRTNNEAKGPAYIVFFYFFFGGGGGRGFTMRYILVAFCFNRV